MELNLSKIIGREGDGSADAELVPGAVIVRCGGCELHPDASSGDCIRCIVRTMCGIGGADRVILRTGTDLEISGAPGRALREAASLMRGPASRGAPHRGKCRTCGMSPEKVMDEVWEVFPEVSFLSARMILEGHVPGDDVCDRCIGSTIRRIEQMESGLDRIARELSEGI